MFHPHFTLRILPTTEYCPTCMYVHPSQEFRVGQPAGALEPGCEKNGERMRKWRQFAKKIVQQDNLRTKYPKTQFAKIDDLKYNLQNLQKWFTSTINKLEFAFWKILSEMINCPLPPPNQKKRLSVITICKKICSKHQFAKIDPK